MEATRFKLVEAKTGIPDGAERRRRRWQLLSLLCSVYGAAIFVFLLGFIKFKSPVSPPGKIEPMLFFYPHAAEPQAEIEIAPITKARTGRGPLPVAGIPRPTSDLASSGPRVSIEFIEGAWLDPFSTWKLASFGFGSSGDTWVGLRLEPWTPKPVWPEPRLPEELRFLQIP